MSRVLLIAADKPLPLCDRRTARSKTSNIGGQEYTISCEAGFAVLEHAYYRPAVDDLGLAMKSYQYELSMEVHEDDLVHLRAYLEQNFVSGEETELWNLWVGEDDLGVVPHYRGYLADFDLDTLRQFICPPHQSGGIGQCCMTVVL